MARHFTDTPPEYLTATDSPITGWGWSMCCWFKPEDNVQNDGIYGIYDASSIGNRSALLTIASTDTLKLLTSGAAVDVESSNSFTYSTWNCVVWTHEKALRQIYLNGTKTTDNTNDLQGVPADLDTLIFGAFRTTSSPADTSLAECAIWDGRVLSDAEMAALYAGYSPLFFPEGLVRYWPLGGLLTANDADYDIVGGVQLTPVATPTTDDHPSGLIYPSQQFIPFPSAAGLPIPVASHHYTKNIGAA